jgi:hypothetical protein
VSVSCGACMVTGVRPEASITSNQAINGMK